MTYRQDHVALMREHVKSLVKEHRVAARDVGTTGREQAFPDKRLVHIRPIRGVASYLGALHEIGHVVVGAPSSTPGSRSWMDQEAAAWQWAIKHAAVPIPDWAFRRIAEWLDCHRRATAA